MTYQHPKFLVAVDCVIFGYQDADLKLLLHHRDIEPAKGQWSLMGGFVSDGESVEDAAMRVLYQTTGLTNIYLEQVAAFSAVDRDPGARVISIALVALIRIDEHDRELVRKNGAHWRSVNEVPKLIFDHNEIVEKGLETLQKRASNELAGRELLPEHFTFGQLRSLYEAIFQRTFDPGNFRKKVLSLNVIERLDIKNTKESKKGAYYHRFKDQNESNDPERIFKIHLKG
jgi:ADP-ribose pyrophosphatase YjhB (NUDIX family)